MSSFPSEEMGWHRLWEGAGGSCLSIGECYWVESSSFQMGRVHLMSSELFVRPLSKAMPCLHNGIMIQKVMRLKRGLGEREME